MPRALLVAVFLVLSASTHSRSAILRVPDVFADIPTALTKATSGDIVRVKRGTYGLPFNIPAGVAIEGEETAATILSAAITWTTEGAALRRVTVKAAVALKGIHSATIENCIFHYGGGTALTLTNCRQTGTGTEGITISHNTFYKSATALAATQSDAIVSVDSNLFAGNTNPVAVTPTTGSSPLFASNHFPLEADNPSGATASTFGDPVFLDEASDPPDLHVTQESPGKDRGAYYGTGADPTPPPPAGVTAVLQADGHSATVTWDPNGAYNVTVSEYGLHFRRTKSETSYSDLGTVPATPESATVDLAPPVPTGVTLTPLDGGLLVKWSTDPRASGYTVSVGTEPGVYGTPVEAGDASGREIGGLTNGTLYYASVAAYAVGDRYLEVTASSSKPSLFSVGDTPQSRPSGTAKLTLTRQTSPGSQEKSAYPEKITGFPPLKDNGACFVGALGPNGGARPRLPGRPLWAAAAALLWLAWVVRRGRSTALLLSILVLLAPATCLGREPRWILTAAGGAFRPAQDDWSDAYDDRWLPEGKVGVGYRPFRQLEIGAEAGYRRATGEIRKTPSGQTVDPPLKQTLSVVPLQAYLLLNLQFADGQWVVPYVAGGYSYLPYRHEIENGDKITGHATGAHGRAGLRIALNRWEPQTAERVRSRLGLQRSFFVLEAQQTWVREPGDVNLGGTSYFAGISLEF